MNSEVVFTSGFGSDLMVADTTDETEDLEQELVELVAKDAVRIPPYPAVAFKIIELLRSDDYDIADLVELIESDQLLAADVLRVASVATYGPDPVSSIRAAVSRVGTRNVSGLALASGIGPEVRLPGPLASLRRLIWQDSLTSALICKALGEKRNLRADESFTCGLLHDFGRIVAVSALEQLLRSRPQLAQQPFGIPWDDVVDRFHVELGHVIATRWQLSRLLTDVMTLHHSGPLDACVDPEMLDVVIASDEIISRARAQPNLTDQDLLLLGRLRGVSECELIAGLLPACPEVIASFETSAAPIPENEPMLRSRTEPQGHVAFQVNDVNQPERSFQATGVDRELFVIEGNRALPTNRLIHFQLRTEIGDLTLWANVQRCEREGERFRIELRPFALTPSAARAWAALLRTQPSILRN